MPAAPAVRSARTSDPRYCPVCGQANRCAVEDARGSGQPPADCWCLGVTIGAAALARIAPPDVDRACLCPRCAAFTTDQPA